MNAWSTWPVAHVGGIDAANNLSAAWATAMGRACWQGGLALALVFTLCRAMPRLPAWVKCWLWRLAYAKLLIGVAWAAPVRLPLLAAPATAAAPPPVEWPHAPVATPTVEADDRVYGQGVQRIQESAPPASHTPAGGSGSSPAGPKWFTALFGLWLAGTILIAARLARAWRATLHLRRRCRPVDDPLLLGALAELARAHALRRPPPLALAAGVASPLLVGPWRPVIVLPATLPSSCAPGELRLMIAHEMAHLKRRDLQWNALAAAAEFVFWFHPLVWLARRQWRLAQEVACDEAAVALTRARPADYAQALLAAVDHFAGQVRAAPRPVAVGIFESGRILERRFVAMKHFHAWSRRRRTFAAAGVLCVGLAAIPSWRVVAKAAPADDKSEKPVRGDKPPADAAAPKGSRSASPGEPTGPSGREAAGESISAVGLIAARTVEIRSAGSGVVRVANLIEGRRVKAGELLVELDASQERIQVEAARADLAKKMVDLRRTEDVYREARKKTPNFTNPELDDARVNAQIGEIAVRYRLAELERMRTIAPFDGVVATAHVQVGQVVGGDPLGTLIDIDHPYLEFTIPADVSARVRPGDRVEADVPALAGRKLTGRVDFISPEVSPQLGEVRVKAKLDEVGAGIKPGMRVVIRLTTSPPPEQQPGKSER